PEVIASEQYLLRAEPDARRDGADEPLEICGPHARVATVLIHLIGRGLDERHRVALLRIAQNRLDDERMRRARRTDPHRLRRLVARDDLAQRLHAMITCTPMRVSASRASGGMPSSVTSVVIRCGSRILCRQTRPNFDESVTKMISRATSH